MWDSKTGQFGSEEMKMLEVTPADGLAGMLMGSDPLVALRALAEVMLNGDGGKLAALMAIPEVAVARLTFGDDAQVDSRDHSYARQLNERFGS